MTIGEWLGGTVAWHLAGIWLLLLTGIVDLVWGSLSGHFRRRPRIPTRLGFKHPTSLVALGGTKMFPRGYWGGRATTGSARGNRHCKICSDEAAKRYPERRHSPETAVRHPSHRPRRVVRCQPPRSALYPRLRLQFQTSL